MLKYNDVLMAQERQADMRRAADEENRMRALLGDADIDVVQRVVAMATVVKQRLMRPKTKVGAVGRVASNKAA